MKLFGSLMLSLLLLVMLIVPAGVTAQEDEMSVTFYITEDGSFSVTLLDGWAADGNRDDGITIANSEEVLAKFNEDEDPAPDDIAIQLLALPPEFVSELGLDEDASYADILNVFVPFIMQENEEELELGEVLDIELGTQAASAIVAIGETSEAALVVYTLAPETLGLAIVAGAPGFIEESSDLALAVLASAQYSLPLEESFEDDLVSFSYPTEWVAQDEGGIYSLTNDAAALEADELEEGQYGIILLNAEAAGISGESTTEIANAFRDQLQEEGDEYSEAIEFEVDGMAASVIEVTSLEEGNEGGVLVVETDLGFLVAVYVNAPGQNYIGLTALNVLLSVE